MSARFGPDGLRYDGPAADAFAVTADLDHRLRDLLERELRARRGHRAEVDDQDVVELALYLFGRSYPLDGDGGIDTDVARARGRLMALAAGHRVDWTDPEEPHVTTDDLLDRLVDDAHARGCRCDSPEGELIVDAHMTASAHVRLWHDPGCVCADDPYLHIDPTLLDDRPGDRDPAIDQARLDEPPWTRTGSSARPGGDDQPGPWRLGIDDGGQMRLEGPEETR